MKYVLDCHVQPFAAAIPNLGQLQVQPDSSVILIARETARRGASPRNIRG